MNKSINQNTNNHTSISNLMEVMNKYVIYSEIDLNGMFTNVSEAFCDISGYSKNNLLGESHKILKDLENKDEFFIKMWKQLDSIQTWAGEEMNLKSDGQEYWLETIISPKYTNTGVLCGYTSIHLDISEKKAIEDLNCDLSLEVKELNEEISSSPKNTKQSIKYASLIQSAVLPNNELFRKYFKEYFAVWHPKDVVGGDIYLFNELRHKDECLFMFIDCTGHGVPGAFVTMLVKAVEVQIIAKILNDPSIVVSTSWIMSYFNKVLKKLLKQENIESMSNVGFDGGIVYYNKKEKILKFCGAETSLYYIDNKKELQIVKGNRYSVGYKKCDENYEYKETVINVEEDMKFYCTTDGYIDQNGGNKDFPFGKKRFTNLIKEYHCEAMAEQQELFLYELAEYEEMQELPERNDDITLIAFTIDKVDS